MCFSLAWLLQLCVWIIIVIALVSIIRIVIPWIQAFAGIPEPIIAIINIIIWAIIAIAALYIIFGLLSCLFAGGAGLHMPALPRG
jgi:hypothetical protein